MKVQEISQASYVSQQIRKLSKAYQLNALNYIDHAKVMGGRICNDGYPDARYKCTFHEEFREIRMAIARYRQKYGQMMYKMHAQAYCVRYQVVSTEVAQSNIDKIRKMFGWEKK